MPGSSRCQRGIPSQQQPGVVFTAFDAVLTAFEMLTAFVMVLTAFGVVLTTFGVVLTSSDVVLTAFHVVLTAFDVVLTALNEFREFLADPVPPSSPLAVRRRGSMERWLRASWCCRR